MRGQLIEALQARFTSYSDIGTVLSDEMVGDKPDLPKHKSMAEHLWCVIGARESYAKALTNGSWSGFGCSMTSFTSEDFVAKLDSSAEEVTVAINEVSDWNDQREQLLLALSEHEVMHEGQIIRHMYAMGIDIPPSVKWA